MFSFERIIGKGGFGRVWKVKDKKSKIVYALKVIDKARVIAKKSVQSIMN
jgi:protein kinase A